MSLKGKQILYNTIVSPSPTESGEVGKRKNIDDKRDAMAHRYYFHAVINRLRYDDCLHNLSKEFFLQPNTIVKELQLRYDTITQLDNDAITTAELRKRYPFFNWVSKLV